MTIHQAVILAGGRGLRLREHTHSLPKALLPVGDRPILDHILYHLSLYGIKRIVIAGGYRFADLLKQGFNENRYGMRVEAIDTGLHADTGGRIGALRDTLDPEPFLLSWCDALSNIDFGAMYAQHIQSDALVTLGAVHPPARFGDLELNATRVVSYHEKAPQLERWISGGYFVVEPAVLDMISSPEASWERDILTEIAAQGRLQAYRYGGPWQCMDTLHEHELLNSYYQSNQAFWPIPLKK